MTRAGRTGQPAAPGRLFPGAATTASQAEKDRALEIFLDAWDLALAAGLAPENIASSAVFAAFTDLVENHGEEFVAQMVEGLAGRIRAGEFTLTHELLPAAQMPDESS